jgi:hypothetical protein
MALLRSHRNGFVIFDFENSILVARMLAVIYRLEANQGGLAPGLMPEGFASKDLCYHASLFGVDNTSGQLRWAVQVGSSTENPAFCQLPEEVSTLQKKRHGAGDRAGT